MLITMASINNTSQFVYTATIIMANQFCLFHLYIYLFVASWVKKRRIDDLDGSYAIFMMSL